METIITGIVAVVDAFKAVDWASFFIWWLGVERVLRAISKVTPWEWDDDLVEWLSKIMPKKKA
jgi:hypothetical protein